MFCAQRFVNLKLQKKFELFNVEPELVNQFALFFLRLYDIFIIFMQILILSSLKNLRSVLLRELVNRFTVLGAL